LLHVLDYYRAFGLTEFVLCVGYGAAAVEALLVAEFGVGPGEIRAERDWHRFQANGLWVTLVDSGPYADKCERLLAARPHIGETPFLLGYADVLSDFDLNMLIDRHASAAGVLTMVATHVRSRYGELVVDPAGVVTAFVEKPVQPALVSAGYFMCDPELFDRLAVELAFEEQVLPLLVRRRAVAAVVHLGLWLAFDTYKDFIEVETLVATAGWPWLARL
jgi:glucose-1-phosphate cytidylyltransferase